MWKADTQSQTSARPAMSELGRQAGGLGVGGAPGERMQWFTQVLLS